MVPCHDYASSYGIVSWFLIFMEFVCIKDSSTLFHIESVYIYCKWVRTSIIIYEVILVFNMSITLSEKLVFMNWLIYIYTLIMWNSYVIRIEVPYIYLYILMCGCTNQDISSSLYILRSERWTSICFPWIIYL